MNMIALLTLCAITTFTAAIDHLRSTADHPSYEDQINQKSQSLIILNQDIFEDVIAARDQHFVKDDQVWFIMFDSPRCKYCHEVLEHWEDFANFNIHQKDFKIAYLFCPRAFDTCNRLGVKGYPTLSVLDGNHVYDYQGLLEVHEMTKFVKEKEYLTQSKQRFLLHVTDPYENL